MSHCVCTPIANDAALYTQNLLGNELAMAQQEGDEEIERAAGAAVTGDGGSDDDDAHTGGERKGRKQEDKRHSNEPEDDSAEDDIDDIDSGSASASKRGDDSEASARQNSHEICGNSVTMKRRISRSPMTRQPPAENTKAAAKGMIDVLSIGILFTAVGAVAFKLLG